jgi:cyclic dehypoxanthinyl futalosine synthase
MGISREQALECFRSDDLIGIGMEADAVRRNLHPEGVVSYAIDGRADLNAGLETLFSQVKTIVDRGGLGAVLHGGAGLPIGDLERLLAALRERFPAVSLHGLSANGICLTAQTSGIALTDALARLRDAGLSSLAGDDAEILDDAVQRGGSRCSAAEWIGVHRAAHALGIRSTAAMVFGGGETLEHRINHLEALRQLQEETGGFTAFTPSAFQMDSAATIPGWEEVTGVEYLKTLAISRMYLDNIENVQANLETQGLKVLQMGLRFGGNDVGSVPEAAPGSGKAIAEEDLRRVIRDAGFRPVQRDLLYRTMYWN